MGFLDNHSLRVVASAATAGTSAVNSSIVDMQGFESATFAVKIGTANAGNYIKIQQNSANSASSMADLTGTKVTAANNGEVVAVEVIKPRERYLRAVVTRGASTTTGEVYCIREGVRKAPFDNNVSSAIVSEVHTSPAEGTA